MDRVTKYDAFDIPVACIFYDSSFNCRGDFTHQSVHELSQSIATRGLDFPLVVQHGWDVEGGLPGGCQYRLLCGHRRFKAITTFLDWTRIPCTVRGHLTERDARLLNLMENLERNDLNPLEEALAIRRLFPPDATIAAMAMELKRSTTWVKYRRDILTLPEEVQQLLAAKMLRINDLRAIMGLPAEKRAEAARAMSRGEAREKTSRKSPHRRKRNSQVNQMMATLFDYNLHGLNTRLMAWVMGRLTDDEILQEIRMCAGQKSVVPCDANDCRIIWNAGWGPERCLPVETPRGDTPDCDGGS